MSFIDAENRLEVIEETLKINPPKPVMQKVKDFLGKDLFAKGK